MALRNPSLAPRIVPFGVERTSSDVMPNGRPAFRVTQRFADTDKYFGGIHGAIDLGNYNCGDAMIASDHGVIRNRRDIYGALITEIHDDDGSVVGYGHLGRFAQAEGARVVPGRTVIGYVGDTGLGGVCHCHFYRRNAAGKLVDPWPLLEQNASTVRYARLNGPGVNVRTKPGGTIYATSTASAIVRASDGRKFSLTYPRPAKSPITGPRHGIAPYPDQWVPWTLGGTTRYVARPLITYTGR